jgi:serine/threonine protein kinase
MTSASPRTRARREKGKPPGTSIRDYTLDADGLAQREKVEGTILRTLIGVSYQVRHTTTGEVSWVKEIGDAEQDAFWKQMEILTRLVHPVLPGLIGFVPPVTDTGYLIMEYMPNGSLDALIKDKARYARLSPTDKAKIAVGIAIGMRYIHAAGVSHRDLKPSNILLDEMYEPRIGDLRISHLVSGGVSMTGSVGMSYLYSAPEIDEGQYDERVDVFSYAMIWWEIATGTSAMTGFPGGKDPGIVAHLSRVKDGARPYQNVGSIALHVIDLLWATDPNKRLSFAGFLDYAKRNNYELVDRANGEEIARYVTRLERFEAKNPAANLREYEDE